ncbi:OmpA family protein [Paraburkholderia sp. J12]|uniref:OmpA family protein n=1 Tax=Paraburkholderia sp. J12 TaxID=2805432 RepID=UPI002ABD1817|nr:OmpA family protein [Paraburkholderia sp. J12]
MKLFNVSLFFSVLSLAACSSASGPTFSANELTPQNGLRTFEVDCHGLFSGPNTCMNAATRICGDKPVTVLESAKSLREKSDPNSMVFQCGKPEAVEPAAAGVAPAVVDAHPQAETVALAGDAYFAFGRAELTPAARTVLDKMLGEQGDKHFSQVTVTGYTDSVGRATANLALSQRRADAVASYLRAHGLNADKVVAVGRGSANTVTSNDTAEGRANNRRVEVAMQP